MSQSTSRRCLDSERSFKKAVERWNGPRTESSTCLNLVAILASAGIGISISLSLIWVTSDWFPLRKDWERLQMIVEGGLLTTGFASMFALGTRVSSEVNCGLGRAICCTLAQWVGGLLIFCLLCKRIFEQMDSSSTAHVAANIQNRCADEDVICKRDLQRLVWNMVAMTMMVDLLVITMMVWWWLIHFGPWELAMLHNRPWRSVTSLVIPVAFSHAWLGHAWHDWLFVSIWLLVIYRLGQMMTNIWYDQELEPATEAARMYERQLEQEEAQRKERGRRARGGVRGRDPRCSSVLAGSGALLV
jgi:hypothetical protein